MTKRTLRAQAGRAIVSNWKSRGVSRARISRHDLASFVDEIGGLAEWNLATVRRWFPSAKLSRAAFAKINGEIERAVAGRIA